MKIKYVGKKDAETAFAVETGITWAPGAEHDITSPALCKRMLNHPDVFEVVELEKVVPADLQQVATPEGDKGLSDVPAAANAANTVTNAAPSKLLMQTTAGLLDLSLLDKDQLHALAKEQGLSIHPNAKAETVAAKLAEAFPVVPESTEGGN